MLDRTMYYAALAFIALLIVLMCSIDVVSTRDLSFNSVEWEMRR